MTTATDTEFPPPIELWRDLEYLLATVWSLFGAPVEIALKQVFDRNTYSLFCEYVGGLENLFRKLILLDAAKLKLDDTSQRASATRAPSHRAPAAFNPEDSDSWRVSFKLRPGPSAFRRPSPPSNKPAHTPPHFFNTLPLAKRLEALQRAFAQPDACVRRLARLIRKRPQVARAIARPVHPLHPTKRARYVAQFINQAAKHADAAIHDSS